MKRDEDETATHLVVEEGTPITSIPPSEPTRPGGPTRGPMREHIEQFFDYMHLPAHLQEVAAPFAQLARMVVATLPRNPERTVCLRKLLEAKDAAVRARIAK